jgi:hypothetical protein
MQLQSLRHLYVTDAPVTFEAAAPPSLAAPSLLASRVPTVLLPEQASDLTVLLTALQTGLQQLPALRQLLMYMGLAMCAFSARQGLVEEVADLDHVLMEAGEALLQALPAVRVRLFRPCLPSSMAPNASMLQVVTLPGLLQSAYRGHGVGRIPAAGGSTAAAAVGQATDAAGFDDLQPEYMI